MRTQGHALAQDWYDNMTAPPLTHDAAVTSAAIAELGRAIDAQVNAALEKAADLVRGHPLLHAPYREDLATRILATRRHS